MSRESGERAAVHDLGYRRYIGTRRPQRMRWRAVVKNMLRMAWKGWWRAKVWIISAAAMVFALGFAMILAVERISKLDGPMAMAAESQMEKALNTALAQSFQWLPWVAFMLTMTVIGNTVARDHEAGAFEFYFSRPVRPIDYVLGKLAGAFLLVGAQLLVGPLLLAIFRVGIDWEHVGAIWMVIPQSLLIGLIVTLFFISVPLAISSFAGKPRNALILWAVLWVVVGGIARLIASATGITAFYALDPYGLILGVTYGFYGWKTFAFRSLPPLGMSIAFLALYCVAAVTILYLRVRSIQRAGLGGRLMSDTPMVELDHCSKWYGPVLGVSEVSWKVSGGVVGLLGPNGAGKSTLIKMITGLLRPSRGTVRVFGRSPFTDSDVRARVGYCPEHEGVYNELTALEFVTTMATLAGVPRRSARDAAAASLERFGMKDAAGRRLRGFSKGMLQRTKLAQAVAHDPELVVLDEPLTGVDPRGRAEIAEMVRSLGASGKTVLISSHVLHEVEAITEEILVIYHGQVLAEGNLYKIRELIDKHPHRIRVECDHPHALGTVIAAAEHVHRLSYERHAIIIETRDPDQCYDLVARACLERSIRIRSLTSPDNNLGSVFEYLTGERR